MPRGRVQRFPLPFTPRIFHLPALKAPSPKPSRPRKFPPKNFPPRGHPSNRYYAGRFEEGAKQFRDDVAVNPNDTEEVCPLGKGRGVKQEGLPGLADGRGRLLGPRWLQGRVGRWPRASSRSRAQRRTQIALPPAGHLGVHVRGAAAWRR